MDDGPPNSASTPAPSRLEQVTPLAGTGEATPYAAWTIASRLAAAHARVNCCHSRNASGVHTTRPVANARIWVSMSAADGRAAPATDSVRGIRKAYRRTPGPAHTPTSQPPAYRRSLILWRGYTPWHET